MTHNAIPRGLRRLARATLAASLGVSVLVAPQLSVSLPSFVGTAEAQTQSGELSARDIQRAIGQIGALSRFFDALADDDTAPEARALWGSVAEAYAAAERRLADLEQVGHIKITDLPGSEHSRVAGSLIQLDPSLAGQWPADTVRYARRSQAGDDNFIGLLSTILLQALLAVSPEQDWGWYAIEQRQVQLDDLPKAPSRAAARRHMARLWYLKDRYFHFTRLVADAATPQDKESLERLRGAVFAEILQASKQLEQELGPEAAVRFQMALLDYDRQVQGYAASAGPGGKKLLTVAEAEASAAATARSGSGDPARFKRVAPLELVQSLEARMDSLEYVMHLRHAKVTEALDRLVTLSGAPLSASIEPSPAFNPAFEAAVDDLNAAISDQRQANRQATDTLRAEFATAIADVQNRDAELQSQLARIDQVQAQADQSLAALSEQLSGLQSVNLELRKELASRQASGEQAATTLRTQISTQVDQAQADTDRQIATLSQDLDEARSAGAALRGQLSASFQTGQQEITARVDQLVQTLDGLRDEDARLTARLADRDQQASAVQVQETLTAALDTNRQEVSQQIASLDTRLNEVQSATGALRADLDADDGSELAALRAELAALRESDGEARQVVGQQIAALDIRLSEVQSATGALRADVDADDGSELAAVRAELATLQKNDGQARQEVGQQFAALDTRLSEVQSATSALRADLDADDGSELVALRSDLAALRESDGQARQVVGQQIAALDARLSEVQNTTGALRADLDADDGSELVALKAELATLRDSDSQARHEVGQQVAALDSRVSEIQSATDALRQDLDAEFGSELAALKAGLASLRKNDGKAREQVGQEIAALDARLTAALAAGSGEALAGAELVLLRDEVSAMVAANGEAGDRARQELAVELAGAVATDRQDAQQRTESLVAALEVNRQEIAGLAQQLAAQASSARPMISWRALAASDAPMIALAVVALVSLMLCLLLWRRLAGLQSATVPAGAVYFTNPPQLVPAPAAAPLPEPVQVQPAPVQPAPVQPAAPVTPRATAATPAPVDPPTPVEPPAPEPTPAEPIPAEPTPGRGLDDGSSGPEPVIEALRRGDLATFETRFAALTGLSPAQGRRIVYAAEGEDLAIVCRALGLDKLHFTSILLLSRKAQPSAKEIEPRNLPRVMAVFDQMTEESALAILEYWRQELGAAPDSPAPPSA